MFTTKKSDQSINEIIELIDLANDELIINQYIKSSSNLKTKEALIYLKDLLNRTRKSYKNYRE